jgi:hypothetical protein
MAPRQRESNDYAIQLRQLALLERVNEVILRRDPAQVEQLQPRAVVESANSTTETDGHVEHHQPGNEQPPANLIINQVAQDIELRSQPSNRAISRILGA